MFYRLFDERLAQLSNELTLLTQPTPTHPEYLAQLQCIDFRRQEKIHLEQTLYQYKLKTMQVNCVAARSQIHGQFYQTVRNIRETKLEEAGEQWYQIQRDRRGWEGTIPGTYPLFSTCSCLVALPFPYLDLVFYIVFPHLLSSSTFRRTEFQIRLAKTV